MPSCSFHVPGAKYIVSGVDETFDKGQDAIDFARDLVGIVYQVRVDGSKYKYWDWKKVHQAEEKRRKKAKEF